MSVCSQFRPLYLSEIEEAVSSIYIIGVGLLIKLNVVTDDAGCELWDVWEVEGLQDLIYMWDKVFHCLLEV